MKSKLRAINPKEPHAPLAPRPATSDPEAPFLAERHLVDSIFDEQLEQVKAFSFDSAVASAFDDMAHRSIPLYGEMQRLTSRLVLQFAQPGTSIYDLGCATGTTLLCLASRLEPSIRIVGVDNSKDMLSRCEARLRAYGYLDRVHLELADVTELSFEPASVVLLHYTLQFLPIAKRLKLLSRIRSALTQGGILLISEKATHGDTTLDSILSGLYWDFKKRNGYSELEISQKREALENVLVPLSITETEAMLQQAGFERVCQLAKCFQFCSFIAYNKS